MQSYTQIPSDKPFKAGDIYIERGFKIVAVEGQAPVHEDIKDVLLRPTEAVLDEAEKAKAAVVEKAKELASEVEKL